MCGVEGEAPCARQEQGAEGQGAGRGLAGDCPVRCAWSMVAMPGFRGEGGRAPWGM